MRKTFIAIATAAVLGPASAYAKDSSDLALALGTVLDSEKFCGLDYDQAAIQAFITKRVSADDMDFPPLLGSCNFCGRCRNLAKRSWSVG